MTLAETKQYTVWLAGWLLCAVWILNMLGDSPLARDDSDPGNWGSRSGVTPRTDHKTGCQYLETVLGGITPRLDGAGRQVGCRAQQGQDGVSR